MSRLRDGDELDRATERALRESNDLIPTSEAEVERAEVSLSEDEPLPAGLQQYRPRARRETAHAKRPRAHLSHVAFAAVGALAAGLAVYFSRPTSPPDHVTSAGSELVPSVRQQGTASVPLVFRSRCERECCAGTECGTASEALRACPSGARCVACGADYASGGPYRLRIGSAVPSATGQSLLPLDAPLELCVSSPTSPAQCLPALVDAGAEQWRTLKSVTTVQDLLSGLRFELRKRGDSQPLASWQQAVSPSPEVMCKGLAISLSEAAPSGEKTETLARVSAFVEQTHFVELSRSATVPPLLARLRTFAVSGIQPQIYETSGAAGARFALVVGPIDRSEADALRWQALDHGIEARVTHGLDFTGKPRPSP